MELNKTQKVILGIFTFLPFIFFPIIFFQIFQFVMAMVATSGREEPEASVVLSGIFSFIVPIILVSLLSLALLILYIVHVVSNKSWRISNNLCGCCYLFFSELSHFRYIGSFVSGIPPKVLDFGAIVL